MPNFFIIMLVLIGFILPLPLFAQDNPVRGEDLNKVKQNTEGGASSIQIATWYFKGCVTGCARGYLLGYWIGRSQALDAKQSHTGVTTPALAWPQGKLARDIDSELAEILSNEPRAMINKMQFPAELPRYISTPDELPIRRAGIYSTFHASVHDGYMTGCDVSASNQYLLTNKYIDKYGTEHPAPEVPRLTFNKILRESYIQMTE